MSVNPRWQDFMQRFRAQLGEAEYFIIQTGMQMPWEVTCAGLTREALGDEHFEWEHGRRRAWCREHCPQAHYIHGLHDDLGRLTGRVFRFEDGDKAVWFKLTFR